MRFQMARTVEVPSFPENFQMGSFTWDERRFSLRINLKPFADDQQNASFIKKKAHIGVQTRCCHTLTWTSISLVPACLSGRVLSRYLCYLVKMSRGHRKHLAHRVSAARGSFPKCGQVHEPYFQPRKTCFQHVPTACSTCSNGFLKHIAKMCDHIQCIFSEPMSQHSPSCKIKGNEKHRIPVQISTKHLKELKSSKIQYLRRSQVIQIEHLARARQETWRSSLHQPKLTRM